jgi:hypothetical protein
MEKHNGDVGGAAAAPVPGTGITNGGGASATATNEVKPSEDGPVSKSFAGLSTEHPNPPATNGNHTKGGGDKEESGTTNGHNSNGGPPTAAAENGDEADADGTELMRVEEEGADEEEALFAELEKQEEEEGKAFEQPKDYHAAPKLLQKDLETGAVKADDSEEESDREHGGTAVADGSLKAAAAGVAAAAEESKPPVVSSHHIHGRVRFEIGCSRMNRAWMCRRLSPGFSTILPNALRPFVLRFQFLPQPQQQQLDLLLNKASQYSNFIARDLDELQASMTQKAARELSKELKGGKKKRKGDKKQPAAGSSSSKKAKGEDGAAVAVASASAGDGKRPIFIQPPNLAAGCYLKNYQLEGVRWLASLFENGVSGILADEMGLCVAQGSPRCGPALPSSFFICAHFFVHASLRVSL